MIAILANTITADMGLIPGLAMVGPAMGLPLSVLAAFLERPFVSLSGLRGRRDAIWFSLQANFVSLLVGYGGLLAAAIIDDAFNLWGPNDPLFTVCQFVAVAISIFVERTYIAGRLRDVRIGWGWMILGNILSAAACISLLMLVGYVRQWAPELRRAVTPYHNVLQALAGLGSLALFAVAFMRTRPRAESRESSFAAVAAAKRAARGEWESTAGVAPGSAAPADEAVFRQAAGEESSA
jgi:hypothetical protein